MREMLRKAVLSTVLISLCCSWGMGQQRGAFVPFINSEHVWVDSVFNTLNQRDKVAQLVMVRAHTNLGHRYID